MAVPPGTSNSIDWFGKLKLLILGPPPPAVVPNRVQAAIKAEQDRSEVLVSLIQCFAIVGFFFLYSLSPKAFPDTVGFEPVPIALMFYGGFTLIRLNLAIRKKLTKLLLSISVIVDISILMITIWSFHLQYQAPPALYLKAPTLMYVFILIALRTLRFEARLVILAGITSAILWMVLVGYAWFADDNMMRTNDYGVYVTSFSILIGAEIDKVVSILTVTAVLALALHRAHKLLVRSATDQQAAAELSRFFAPEVAGRIAHAEQALQPGQAELRRAAIMFVDLRGFTTLSNRIPPNEVMTVLGEYQARMVKAILEHDGSIDKFMGDGILASFGATQSLETPMADAYRALEHVIIEGRNWNSQRAASGKVTIPVAAALAEGDVMFGIVGGSERLEYTVIGEAVNLAAKLEKHCKTENVAALAPQHLYDMAIVQGFRPKLDWSTRTKRQVFGVEDPVDLAVLSGKADDGMGIRS